MSEQVAEQVQVPPILEKLSAKVLKAIPEVTVRQIGLLEGFRDLVAERTGYYFGAIAKRQEMNDDKAIKPLRKNVTETREKMTGEALEELIANSDIEGYKKIQKELKAHRKTLREKETPYREKINPLNKAVKFLDTVTIPDALKELGTPITPRFTLSDYVKQAMESNKK